MSDIAIQVSHLSKCYHIYDNPKDRLKQTFLGGFKQYYKEFWALRDVSFEVKKGEALGIIGRNGSGKSTLLQLIASTLHPTSGEIEVNGRVAALLELGSGFNPEFTGRENVYLNGSVLGLSRTEIDARFDEIAAFADIGEFIEQPVKTYSSGMFVRLAFAVQACIDPDIFIVDEALAVGDIFFRQKCYQRFEQLRNKGCAVLLVSHGMGDVEQHCDRAILLDHGKVIRYGSSAEAIKEYYLLEQASRFSGVANDLDLAMVSNCDNGQLPFPEMALLPLDGVSQINAHEARCLRVALTDVNGQPRRSFRFGEIAVFHHEHYFGNHSGIPVGGVIIHTEKGVILHGKSSIQTRMPVERPALPGSIVRFEHRVTLLIASGEYTFDVGMSAVSTDTFADIEQLSHEEIDELKIRLVQVVRVASFTMLHPEGLLPIHGLVDLPTDIRASVASNSPQKTMLAGI